MFTTWARMGSVCEGLTGYANVVAPSSSPVWFLWGVYMKKLAAVIFFAMVGTNAMAQAGGASSGAGGTGASAAAGATAGTVATVAAVVAGVAAASTKSSSNH